ncbi:MAG TPA: hypothetical protein VFT50_03180 [Baekduia sp.]|nr:hypothetical protein [Baekduia sp.]
MVWVALLAALWISSCLLVVALAHAAARADRPTRDHLSTLSAHGVWLAPSDPSRGPAAWVFADSPERRR